MPSFLADYRDLPRSTRIVTAILLPILLLAGVIGGSSATTYVAAIGERCTLDMPIGTIVELDITGIFAQRIARYKWQLTSDIIVDNCYVKDHIRQTKADCETQDRACRLTLSSVGTTVRTSDGQTWTKTGINEWQNGSGDTQNDADMFRQSTSTQHNAAGTSGQPTCKPREPTDRKPCSSSSAPKERATHSSSSANTCTAVYYKFDEGAGTTTLNALGSNHPGTIDGASWAIDHAPTLFANSGAMQFDGSNRVEVPTLAAPGTPFTISTWIKAPMTENADQIVVQWGDNSWLLAVGHQTFTEYECVYTVEWPSGPITYRNYAVYDSHGFPVCDTRGSAVQHIENVRNNENYYFGVNKMDWSHFLALRFKYAFDESWQMPHSEWVHLVYVNNGSTSNPSTNRLYVNGVDMGLSIAGKVYKDPETNLVYLNDEYTGLEADAEDTFEYSPMTGLTIGNLNSTATWGNSDGTPSVQSIGYWMHNQQYVYYDYPAQGFNGLIDDVRVYTRALSAGEVASLATGADVSFNCTR